MMMTRALGSRVIERVSRNTDCTSVLVVWTMYGEGSISPA